jgi:hypothetical protein
VADLSIHLTCLLACGSRVVFFDDLRSNERKINLLELGVIIRAYRQIFMGQCLKRTYQVAPILGGLLLAGLAACQVTPNSSLAAEPQQEATQAGHGQLIQSSLPTMQSRIPPSPTLQPTPTRDTDRAYSTVDRPDDVGGYEIHFIYALPSDGKDDFLDVDGKIELSAEAMNNWLQSKTDHHLRYDTYQGALDVSFMRLEYTADQISSIGADIVNLMDYEIKTRGFNTTRKLYVVHYDGFFVSDVGFCGIAQYPPEGAGITAVLLLRGYNPKYELPCPRQFTKSADYTGYFEVAILHELLHLMGMVPNCAPHNKDGHVSDSSQDLMYFQYDGTYSPLYTYLDYHNDDYYDAGIPDCPDLARSVFLEPQPQAPELPPGWNISSIYIPPNPLTP